MGRATVATPLAHNVQKLNRAHFFGNQIVISALAWQNVLGVIVGQTYLPM